MDRLLFTIFFSLLSCYYSFSVDKDLARRVAQAVLNVKQAEQVVLVEDSFPGTKGSKGDDFSPFYVFNDDHGFVIVSGHEAAHPVLAYSKSGQFDASRIPPAMKELLMMMSTAIVGAKQASLKPSKETQAEWDQYLSGTKASGQEVLLETAHWGQGSPYNDMCPLDQGEHSVTGCANTATAIIMRYHKWPEKGQGTLPDYENYVRGSIVSFHGHDLGHSYDWDSMPTTDMSFDNSLNEHQKKQVAQLMYDVGTMNRAAYSKSATVAGLNEAGMVGYFNYDNGIKRMSRGDYSRDLEWEEIIKKEIDSSRPVYYGLMLDYGEQHAVVIDGYRDRLFHINFGWSGDSDAFMMLSPIEGEESKVTREYHRYQHMVVGIQPNKNNNPKEVRADYLYISDDFDYNVGKEFSISALLSNYSSEIKNAFVAVGLTDGNGNLEEIISPTQEVSVNSSLENTWFGGWTSFNTKCTIHNTLRSDQTIQLFQLENNEWHRIISNANSVIHMGHGGQLSKMAELEFIKTIPDDVEWKRVCFRLPLDAMLKIEDDSLLWDQSVHTIRTSYEQLYKYNSSNDLRITTQYDNSGGLIGYVVVDKKKTSSSRTIHVTVYDMEETFSFSLTL